VLGELEFHRVKHSVKDPEFEFDVAVFGRDTFALVECKATGDVKSLRAGSTRSASIARSCAALAGGGAWLVAPAAKEESLRATGLQTQARSQGVTVNFGPNAVQQVTGAIAGLYN
jgi:hypothetical protein